MNWKSLLIFFSVLALVVLLRRLGLVSARAAREHLKQGAVVVDVRSEGEFASGHLPKAINIPVDKIETVAPRRFANRGQVLLLHCQSGMRSGIAKRKLRALGYANAFNLGSYSRAAQIVRGD
jgi:phage shock protein E